MELQQLTPSEYDQHIAEATFRLGFIGMSNVGKTHRSKKLERDADFFGYHVDDEIQQALGLTSTEELSHWLGYPSDDTYAGREAQYLALESRYTKVDCVDTGGKNLVFDTTGSVIYLDTDTQQWLREQCLLVHMDAGDDALEPMIKLFFEQPKPLVWAGHYVPRPGESREETARRCYPALLKDRLARYRALAHLSIPTEAFSGKTGTKILDVIRSYLAA